MDRPFRKAKLRPAPCLQWRNNEFPRANKEPASQVLNSLENENSIGQPSRSPLLSLSFAYSLLINNITQRVD